MLCKTLKCSVLTCNDWWTFNPLSRKSDQYENSPCFLQQIGDENYGNDHTRYNESILQQLLVTTFIGNV